MGVKNRWILLVEDSPQERDTIRKYLGDENLRVEAVPDYHNAVVVLEVRVPSLVCLDLTLPRESGYELCEYMRARTRFAKVPILVVSDRASPEDMAHAEHVGANAFLKKPFTRKQLVKYVTVLLDGPHGSRPSVRRLRPTEPPSSR